MLTTVEHRHHPCQLKFTLESTRFFATTFPLRLKSLQRRHTAFAAADADGLFPLVQKNLAVADLPGSRGIDDGVHHRIHQLVIHHDLQLDLGKNVHGIFVAVVNLGMPFLPAMPAHFRCRHAFHAHVRQRLFHGVELGRLNDRLELYHRCFLSLLDWIRTSLCGTSISYTSSLDPSPPTAS